MNMNKKLILAASMLFACNAYAVGETPDVRRTPAQLFGGLPTAQQQAGHSQLPFLHMAAPVSTVSIHTPPSAKPVPPTSLPKPDFNNSN